MDHIALLEGVLIKTGNILAGVRPDQMSDKTPCPEFDVSALMNHIVGWVQVFEAGCNGREFTGDAALYECSADPAAEFRSATTSIVNGWRSLGLDRPVRISSGDSMPGEMVFNMTLMEYLAHGWDLAAATGQTVPFTEDEGAAAFARARTTLPAEYQGAGMPFGAPVEVGASASAVEQFIGFMGRDPHWTK